MLIQNYFCPIVRRFPGVHPPKNRVWVVKICHFWAWEMMLMILAEPLFCRFSCFTLFDHILGFPNKEINKFWNCCWKSIFWDLTKCNLIVWKWFNKIFLNFYFRSKGQNNHVKLLLYYVLKSVFKKALVLYFEIEDSWKHCISSYKTHWYSQFFVGSSTAGIIRNY